MLVAADGPAHRIWLAIAALSATDAGGLTAAMLPTALRDTATLMASVGIITGILGLVSAWLVESFRVPRPPYLRMGAGPAARHPDLSRRLYLGRVPRFHRPHPAGRPRHLRRCHHQRLLVPPRSTAPQGGAFVLSMVLYPYVYAACRAFFVMQSGSVSAAARTLGAGASAPSSPSPCR